MDPQSQDIYVTRRKEKTTNELLTAEPSSRPNPILQAEMRRAQRSIMLFRIALLMSATLLGVIVFQQYLLFEKPQPESPFAAPRKTSSLVMKPSREMDAESLYLMDELAPVEESELPEEGPVPLEPQWVKHSAYYLVLAEKAYREESWDDALKNYSTALRVVPDLKGVHRLLGIIHLKRKDYTNAITAFRAAADEETMSPSIANNLAVAYLAQEDFKSAEEVLVLARQLQPTYSLADFNLAMLYVRTGELQKAAESFQRYLERRPDDVDATQNYALILTRLERWEEAVRVLEPLSRSAPNVPPIHFRLAQSLSHVGRESEAINSLRKGSLMLDPKKALSWLSRPEYNDLRKLPEFEALTDELASAGQ